MKDKKMLSIYGLIMLLAVASGITMFKLKDAHINTLSNNNSQLANYSGTVSGEPSGESSGDRDDGLRGCGPIPYTCIFSSSGHKTKHLERYEAWPPTKPDPFRDQRENPNELDQCYAVYKYTWSCSWPGAITRCEAEGYKGWFSWDSRGKKTLQSNCGL